MTPTPRSDALTEAPRDPSRALAVSRWRSWAQQARAIVYDFDGTLVDSNPIKIEAFDVCFAQHRDRLDTIRAYCRGHHDIPRGEKFRHVVEQILGERYTPEVAADLHARFEQATTPRVIHAREIPGALAFVRSMRAGRFTALLSTTPHDSPLRVLEARGWVGLFERIQGSPVRKADWLRALRSERGLGAADLVFIGDTEEDRRAAENGGCAFVPVSAGSGERLALGIADFAELAP